MPSRTGSRETYRLRRSRSCARPAASGSAASARRRMRPRSAGTVSPPARGTTCDATSNRSSGGSARISSHSIAALRGSMAPRSSASHTCGTCSSPIASPTRRSPAARVVPSLAATSSATKAARPWDWRRRRSSFTATAWREAAQAASRSNASIASSSTASGSAGTASCARTAASSGPGGPARASRRASAASSAAAAPRASSAANASSTRGPGTQTSSHTSWPGRAWGSNTSSD